MAPREQKRDSKGRYKEMPKAKKISPDPTPRPAPASASSASPAPKAKGSTSHAAPKGHLGDGIGTVHEYVAFARKVYAAFLKRVSR